MGGIVDQFCVNNNGGGGQYDTSNNNMITINNIVDKKSTPSPPPSPSSPSSSPNRNKLKLFHRRISFHGGLPLTRTSASPYYAGPIPTGSGGAPLKSCMKKSSKLNRCNTKQVSFQCVYLRDYCRCVSDNPSVTSGCPLGIGWKYSKRGTVDIDTFEANRSRSRIDLPCRRLTSNEREAILSSIGISHNQIIQGQISAYNDRQLRAETLEQIGGIKNCKSIGPKERMYIMKESALRKLHRAKKGNLSVRGEQEKLWENARESARRRSFSNSTESTSSQASWSSRTT